jgi:hypothetical protein
MGIVRMINILFSPACFSGSFYLSNRIEQGLHQKDLHLAGSTFYRLKRNNGN